MRPSTKKAISSALKAIHKQKEIKRLELNKQEQAIVRDWGIFRKPIELIMAITKELRNK